MKPFVLLAALLALSLCALNTAIAGSTTWKLDATSNDWNTAANWTPETVPDQPTDIATFHVSDMTDVSVSSYVFLDSLVFDSGASAYNIVFHGGFDGAGAINNSGVT